ncbi:hypothetical protein D3C73_1131410 [compost metagenome]
MLAWIVPESSSAPATREAPTEGILGAITMGTHRTFEHDPRFGLSVLSEIASRALSPAVNDPGTAIDVIGRGVRSLTCWGQPPSSQPDAEPDCRRVYVQCLDVDDLFDDFFGPIARDGAGLLEVDMRMTKALLSLAEINPTLFKPAASRHAARLLGYAQNALGLDEDKRRLRELAQPLLR